MPVDDFAHARFVEPERLRQHLDRPLEIGGVLSNDRNAEGVAILDQHAAIAIEHDTARRAQRQRPLNVVFGHLLELRVLHDLQHPEADRQRRKDDDEPVLEDAQADADPPPILMQRHR